MDFFNLKNPSHRPKLLIRKSRLQFFHIKEERGIFLLQFRTLPMNLLSSIPHSGCSQKGLGTNHSKQATRDSRLNFSVPKRIPRTRGKSEFWSTFKGVQSVQVDPSPGLLGHTFILPQRRTSSSLPKAGHSKAPVTSLPTLDASSIDPA